MMIYEGDDLVGEQKPPKMSREEAMKLKRPPIRYGDLNDFRCSLRAF